MDVVNHFCAHSSNNAPVPSLSESTFDTMVPEGSTVTSRAGIWCATNNLLAALQRFRQAQDELGTEDRASCRSSDTDRTHYDLQQRDLLVLTATVNGGVAIRCQLIPILAHHLQRSAPGEDMYDVFLRTHNDLLESVPDQIPEFRSTLKKKLCLKSIISSPSNFGSVPESPSILSCIR